MYTSEHTLVNILGELLNCYSNLVSCLQKLDLFVMLYSDSLIILRSLARDIFQLGTFILIKLDITG